VTVVTDLVTVHAAWADPDAELCIVPTREAYDLFRTRGFPAEKLVQAGFPVHPKFAAYAGTRHEARVRLGIDLDPFTLLVTSGGVGSGQLRELVLDLDRAYPGQQLTIFDENKVVAQQNFTTLASKYGKETEHWNGMDLGLNARFQNGLFTTLTAKNGPFEGIVPSIVDDNDGNVWVGVNAGSGVVRFSPSEMDKVAVDRLLEHEDIAAVSFVGSTPIARYIYETGTRHGKRVQALGGAKNHMVVLPDADFDQVTDALVSADARALGGVLGVVPADAENILAWARNRGQQLDLVQREQSPLWRDLEECGDLRQCLSAI
jgi:hypothetical protein